jgi:hypothetical protein
MQKKIPCLPCEKSAGLLLKLEERLVKLILEQKFNNSTFHFSANSGIGGCSSEVKYMPSMSGTEFNDNIKKKNSIWQLSSRFK